MKRARFTEEQKIGVLHEAAGQDGKVREICRRHGIFYRWRANYGGLQVSEARRLKGLEEENRRLKKLVADLALDNAMPKDLVGRRW
jgi:putative transposase